MTLQIAYSSHNQQTEINWNAYILYFTSIFANFLDTCDMWFVPSNTTFWNCFLHSGKLFIISLLMHLSLCLPGFQHLKKYPLISARFKYDSKVFYTICPIQNSVKISTFLHIKAMQINLDILYLSIRYCLTRVLKILQLL